MKSILLTSLGMAIGTIIYQLVFKQSQELDLMLYFKKIEDHFGDIARSSASYAPLGPTIDLLPSWPAYRFARFIDHLAFQTR